MSYCDAASHPIHGPYHDDEYGFPVSGEAELFERLVLEINQAGLSWLTILRKRAAFRNAYSGFDPAIVAGYGREDRERLLSDAGIVRNRLKIDAAIHNASVILRLREEYASFANWIDAHHPRELAAWMKLFRATFRFTGGEIVNEFLVSTGWLPGAHRQSCPVFARIISTRPPWMTASSVSAPKPSPRALRTASD